MPGPQPGHDLRDCLWFGPGILLIQPGYLSSGPQMTPAGIWIPQCLSPFTPPHPGSHSPIPIHCHSVWDHPPVSLKPYLQSRVTDIPLVPGPVLVNTGLPAQALP